MQRKSLRPHRLPQLPFQLTLGHAGNYPDFADYPAEAKLYYQYFTKNNIMPHNPRLTKYK
jgi:hypothetical protein